MTKSVNALKFQHFCGIIKEKILFHLGHHLIGTPFTEIDDEEEDLGHQKDTT